MSLLDDNLEEVSDLVLTIGDTIGYNYRIVFVDRSRILSNFNLNKLRKIPTLFHETNYNVYNINKNGMDWIYPTSSSETLIRLGNIILSSHKDILSDDKNHLTELISTIQSTLKDKYVSIKIYNADSLGRYHLRIYLHTKRDNINYNERIEFIFVKKGIFVKNGE